MGQSCGKQSKLPKERGALRPTIPAPLHTECRAWRVYPQRERESRLVGPEFLRLVRLSTWTIGPLALRRVVDDRRKRQGRNRQGRPRGENRSVHAPHHRGRQDRGGQEREQN